MKTVMRLLLVVFGSLQVFAGNHYVAHDGQSPVHPYDIWSNAASNIQDAVNAASSGSTVWVKHGRYTVSTNSVDQFGTNVVFINKPLTLRASGSATNTLIDGEGRYRCVGAYYGGTSASGIVIDGFTITNGFAPRWGGGLWFAAKGPGDDWTGKVLNCLVTDCTCVSTNSGMNAEGGGIAMIDSTADGVRSYYTKLLVSNCVVRANLATNTVTAKASWGGGIIYRGLKGASVLDSRIEANRAGSTGGGVYLQVNANSGRGPLKVSGCIIRDNAVRHYADASSGGGGLYLTGPVDVLNTLIYNNVARSGPTDYFSGGGCYVTSSYINHEYANFYNCTIVSNNAFNIGGGLCVRDWSNIFNNTVLTLYNTTILSNTATAQADIAAASGSRPHTNFAYHSCFPASALSGSIQEGTGNLHVSPKFVDYARQDFRLSGSSPCINAGTNQAWMVGAIDLDGNRRIDRAVGTVDIGCYEYVYHGTLLQIR